MYLFFGLAAAVDLLYIRGSPALPPKLDYLAGALAFVIEGE